MSIRYIQSLLGERERTLLMTRQHWFTLVRAIFLEGLLILVIVVAVSLLLGFFPEMRPFGAYAYLLVLLPLISLVIDSLVWANRLYVVTSRRVMQVSGIFSKTVTDSSLEKVNDIKLEQSALGRLFDYGDIEVLTASERGVDEFERVGQPIKFKTAMLNAKEALQGGEERRYRADDIPTMIANLDQLRQQGILSEAEFQEKKNELLARL